MANELKIIEEEEIVSKIYFIRGKRVIMDKDLALLYGVDTKQLNRQLKRNLERFPADFMFQLTKAEFENLRCQIGTSKETQGGRRDLPYVCSENGVAMMSSVLRSKRAIQVNIQIMRTFTKFREMLSIHKELQEKIEQMERKYDQQFKVVFEAIKHILTPPEKPKQIGFIKEKKA